MVLTARIHSIETSGTVDGPGIRYVVFMQGCPLRCKYCHNPDTWKTSGGTERAVDILVQDVLKYKSFMEASGGGVTVSGGEPLLQKAFLLAFFKRLREKGIRTALDTSGYTDIDPVLADLLSYTDLVLLDLKHLSSDRHRELTGQGNDKVIAFLDYLKKRRIPTWIRWVVLPGFNDTDADAASYADFIKAYDNVVLVELLPYHAMGAYKWQALGLSYPLEGVRPPSKERMADIADVFYQKGVRTLLAQ